MYGDQSGEYVCSQGTPHAPLSSSLVKFACCDCTAGKSYSKPFQEERMGDSLIAIVSPFKFISFITNFTAENRTTFGCVKKPQASLGQ